MRQTRERQDRNDALRAEIERAEGLGIVGRAVPYGEPTEIRAGAVPTIRAGRL